MRFKLGQKGVSLNQLTAVGLTFVLIGLFLGLGAFINNQVATGTVTTVGISNESVNFAVTETYYATAYPIAGTVTVYNDSALTTTWPAVNYTWGDQAVKVTTSDEYPAGEHYLSYLAFNDTADSNYYIAKNATAGLSQLSAWLPIIAIVIAAGVVITVLVGSFALKKEEGL